MTHSSTLDRRESTTGTLSSVALVVGVTSCLTAAANFLVPLYFSSIGIGTAVIAILVSLYYAAMIPAEAGWGVLADRHGPRRLLSGATAGSGVVTSFLLAPAGVLLVAAQLIRPTLEVGPSPYGRALMVSVAAATHRGRIVGAFYAMVAIASAVGAALCGWGIDILGFAMVIVIITLMRLATAVLCYGVLSDTPISAHSRAETKGAAVSSREGWRTIASASVVSAFWFAGWGVMGTFLALFAVTEVSLSATQAGLLFLVTGVVGVLLMVPFGWIADVWDRRRLVMLGIVGVGASLLIAAGARDFAGLALAAAIYGVAQPAFAPALASLVASGTPVTMRGRAMGVIGAGENVGVALGPLAIGFFWEIWGPRSALTAAGLVVLVGVPLTLALLRDTKSPMTSETGSATDSA